MEGGIIIAVRLQLPLRCHPEEPFRATKDLRFVSLLLYVLLRLSSRAKPRDLRFACSGSILPMRENRRSFDSGAQKQRASAQDDNS
jgi:hypothetical protein